MSTTNVHESELTLKKWVIHWWLFLFDLSFWKALKSKKIEILFQGRQRSITISYNCLLTKGYPTLFVHLENWCMHSCIIKYIIKMLLLIKSSGPCSQWRYNTNLQKLSCFNSSLFIIHSFFIQFCGGKMHFCIFLFFVLLFIYLFLLSLLF